MDIGVVGLGLIGGSVLRALAAAGHGVRGYDADPGTRALARTAAAQVRTGTRWQVVPGVREALSGTQLLVVAVPLPAVAGVFEEVARAGYRGLVTDVTSVKAPVRELARAYGLRAFVGGHPMAGRERAGFAAGDAELFRGQVWVLCLEPGETALQDWLGLAALLTGLGVRVVPATAQEHDRAVAAVSHVPHLLAVALAARAAAEPLAATLAAGSFRDGTRVAASPPGLVAAMCGGNAAPVAETLDVVLADLNAARAALDGPDPVAALRPWAEPGHAARLAWPAPAGEPVEVPVGSDALLRLGRAGGWVTAVSTDRRSVTAVRPAPV